MDKNPQNIKSMFSEIASSYDRANDTLSLGIHHLWKKKLIKMSGAQPGQHVLDCATGTGDLALLFKEKVGRVGSVIGTDFCQEMLEEAPIKAHKKGLDVRFQLADAMALPFEDNQFDISSISFGIRNVEKPLVALSDMARVTKSGGVVMVLEFGQVSTPGLKQVYDIYSSKILPFVGGMISGKPSAYQYLNDSSQEFPCAENFQQKILSTGKFQAVEFKTLSLGVAYIYRCQVK